MRVLFVAGEVAPFSDTTETSRLLRVLPEALQEAHDVEPRIMMPRYGIVSERRNRLHEVIRLSGDTVEAGGVSEQVRVKVASIPGIRLQVYFIDAVHFFKRKGLYRDRASQAVFADNAARALFYARAAFGVARKLNWNPEIVHASGWIASLVPHVLQTEFADDPALEGARVVYTPDVIEGFEPEVSAEDAATLGLPEAWAGRSLRAIGLETADVVLYAPADAARDGEPGGATLTEDAPEQVVSAYGTLLSRA